MRINLPNALYAVRHPLRAVRYVWRRDRIAYPAIARFLPAAPVIVEAGADDGTNTVEMADFWPDATIHAFEPVPRAAERVSERIRPLGPRVQLHPFGLGPRDAEVEMHLSGDGRSGGSQSSSMLAPTAAQIREFPGIAFGLRQTVPMRTIDSWAAAQGVDHVDFLWLDMQGYELEALSGASRILPTVAAIHMEVCNIELYEHAPLYPEVRKRLAEWGFRPAIEAIFRVAGNVLFVRSP
ncbi:MAG: FkbM family methyltransferase [Planctomycetia bacterium]